MSKPFFVELAGLPAAGKTTTASLLFDVVSKAGLRCTIVPESAARSPLPHLKRKWQFNAWTLCQDVANILEHDIHPSNELVVFDRGIFDALCWIMWLRLKGEIDQPIAEALESFARIKNWLQRPDLVIVLRAKFETALRRRGQPGRILNAETYSELHKAYDLVLTNMISQGLQRQIHILDTDDLSPSEVLGHTMSLVTYLWPSWIHGNARQRWEAIANTRTPR